MQQDSNQEIINQEKRSKIHNYITSKAEAYNKVIIDAATVAEMMKHPGFDIFMKRVQDEFESQDKCGILNVSGAEDLSRRQGATIALSTILKLPNEFTFKSKQPTLTEQAAIALFGKDVIDNEEFVG